MSNYFYCRIRQKADRNMLAIAKFRVIMVFHEKSSIPVANDETIHDFGGKHWPDQRSALENE